MYKFVFVVAFILLPVVSSAYTIDLQSSDYISFGNNANSVYQSSNCGNGDSSYLFIPFTATTTGAIDIVILNASLQSSPTGYYFYFGTSSAFSFGSCPSSNKKYFISADLQVFHGTNEECTGPQGYNFYNGSNTINGCSNRFTVEGHSYYFIVGSSYPITDSLSISYLASTTLSDYDYATTSVSGINWLYGLFGTGALVPLNFSTTSQDIESYQNGLNINGIDFFSATSGIYTSNMSSSDLASIFEFNSTTADRLPDNANVLYGNATSGGIAIYATDTSVIYIARSLYTDPNSSSSLISQAQVAFPFSLLLALNSIIGQFSSSTLASASTSRLVHIPVGPVGTATIDIAGTVGSSSVLTTLRKYEGALVYVAYFLGVSLALISIIR